MNSKYPDAPHVWQRVLAPEPLEQQSLQALMQQLGLDISFLKQLSKGNEDRTMGLLVSELVSQLQCIKGLLILSGNKLPRMGDAKVSGHHLAQCYDHALKRLSGYRLRSSDPVYGPVFQSLARQTEQHCQWIVELLGQLSYPKRPNTVR